MKRMMIATALTTTLATSAFAVTDAQIDRIETFAPGVNTEVMSEGDLQIAYGIVTSGGSRGDKIAQLRALATESDADEFAVITEAEMNRLMQYAPDADLSSISQSQAEAALAVTYGGASEGDKSLQVQSILTDERVIDTIADDITAGQIALIETYVPDVDASTLTEEQFQLVMTYIHSGMSRSDKLTKIEGVIGS